MIFDPGVGARRGLTGLRDVLKNVDYVVLNSMEIENMTGKSDSHEAYEEVRRRGIACNLISKCGSEGCVMVGDSGERYDVLGIDLKEMGMQVVNTVGAGDAFLGAFTAYKSLGFSDYDCIVRGNAAGAFKVTKSVTRGSPTKEELEAFISKIERRSHRR